MGKISELSECELIAMKCIWDAKDPITCQDIMERLRTVYGLEYKDTTVYTFMKNLKNKGFVDSYRKGVTYFFAIRDEESYRDEELRRSSKFWFGDSASKFVSALVNTKKLTNQEKEELKKLIDELD